MVSTLQARADPEPTPLPGYTVLTAIDENYLSIFALWLRSFESSGYLAQLQVITYDTKARRFAERRGLSCIHLAERFSDPRRIFVSRLEVVRDLIDSGTHVIHTDADAFWLRPDVPSLIKPGVDLHVSVGGGIPQQALEEWGFTLCCGFFILHATDRSRAFLPTWLERTREMKDDQRALNELLLAHEVQWEESDTTGRIGRCPSLDLRVEAISSAVISRQTPTGVQIFHPYLPGRFEQLKLLQLAPKLETSRRRVLVRQGRILLDVRAWQRTLGHLAKKILARVTRP